MLIYRSVERSNFIQMNHLFMNHLFPTGNAIRLERFRVPGAVHSGSSLFLHCDFDLEGDSLYSVKW